MTQAIRVLALDHFSAQDRNELIAAAGPRFAWRVVPYWRFRDGANTIFPADVQEGLAAYADPELQPRRDEFATWLRRELRRLFLEWPFDAIVLPSDAYYYVRALPSAAHELGIPVLVVQKETTITDRFFEEHAPDVEAHAPFISDYMTVCSERHKRFWVAAGSDPNKIEVTGQPRFDLYVNRRRGLTWDAVGLEPHPRTALFLSYEKDAYMLDPEDRRVGWRDLRDQTESVLLQAGDEGWRVVVKLHPLQPYEEEASRLARLPGFGSRLQLVPPDTDTRLLITLADAVVGFQTTALFEAMAIDKPVAYTAWGALYGKLAAGMIPFHERPDLLTIATTPDELASWLRDQPQPVSAEMSARRRPFIHDFLGPFDGGASVRTLAAIERLVAASRARPSSSRRRLLAVSPAYAAVSLTGAASKWLALRTIRVAASPLPDGLGSRVRRAIDYRLAAPRERLGLRVHSRRTTRP